MMISQEKLYQAIQQEDWKYLITVLHEKKENIQSDTLLAFAARTFITEFLKKIDDYHDDKLNVLESLFTLDMGKFYKLEEADRKRVICQIVKWKEEEDKLEEAYNYAKRYPNEKICKAVIAKYEKSKPKTIEHSQDHRISVTEKKEVSNVDYTINLFKSTQEAEFFVALKKTYDSYQIYPNVSISCVLNWQLLQTKLTSEEKSHFFKGIVDFVVFDQAEGYKPIHFFELDSVYHDTKEQKEKDELKDSIFAKAGVKIKRIRKMDKNVREQEFVKLIREIK